MPNARIVGDIFKWTSLLLSTPAIFWPLQRPSWAEVRAEFRLSKFILWHCCDMCICDFTRLMYNLQLWYRMSNRLWGEPGGCNRSPQRTKWTFWSIPPRACLPGFHPFLARSLQLQRCDLSTMVGLMGVRQASVLLMAAGTNDQNSWKRSRAAKTHFC